MPKYSRGVLRLLGVLMVVALLARETAGSGCPLGSCPACGACLQPPAVELNAADLRVGRGPSLQRHRIAEWPVPAEEIRVA